MSWLDSLEEIRNTDWSAATSAERKKKADEVITISSYAGALTAVVPIPAADVALLLPVHTAMVMTVGQIYDRAMGEAEAKRVVLELGAITGLAFAGHAAIGLLKRLLLPGVGGLLSMPATFALTWAVGQLAMAYFSDPSLSKDDLRSLFKEAIKQGGVEFDMEAFDRFRRKYGETRGTGSKSPEASGAPDDASAPPSTPAAASSPAGAEQDAHSPAGAASTPPTAPERRSAAEGENTPGNTLRPKKRTL